LERDLHKWFEDRLLPITDAIADRWGFLSAEAQTRGKPLANIDGLIADTALEQYSGMPQRALSGGNWGLSVLSLISW